MSSCCKGSANHLLLQLYTPLLLELESHPSDRDEKPVQKVLDGAKGTQYHLPEGSSFI